MRIMRWIGVALSLTCLALAGCGDSQERIIPLTTESDEARQAFVKGREALETFRFDEARESFMRALEQDPNFAMAHLGLAETAPTDETFVSSLNSALESARGASDGERSLIQAVNAGRLHKLREEFDNYSRSARRYPQDARAQVRLGDFYMKQGNDEAAIEAYDRAIELDPEFSVPFRRMALAYQSLGRFEEAEGQLAKYIEINPGVAKGHVLYGRLLMKTGRFDESIASFEQALALDSGNAEAHLGLGNDLLLLDRADEALAAFGRFSEQAKDADEKRTALVWAAAVHVHQEAPQQALDELRKAQVLAENNPTAWARLLELMGTVMLETGDADGADAAFKKSLAIIERSDISAIKKWHARTNHVYLEGRVAIARNDRHEARSKILEYRDLAGTRWVDGAMEKFNELGGLIDLAAGKPDSAVEKFLLAGNDDPRIYYLAAQAYRPLSKELARAMCRRILELNEPSFELAFVRAKARRMLDEI